MVRAWKHRNDIQMSGFLIDTLCYNFFKNTTDYDKASFGSFDKMVRDFFQYLTKEPKKEYYYAFGSNSQVGVKKAFQADAQIALNNAIEAIEAREAREGGYEDKCNQRYKAIFGTKFPNREAKEVSAVNEQFIEELFDLDITNQIVIDCEIKSDLMTRMLSSLKFGGERIQHQRKLHFFVKQTDIGGLMK